MHTLTEENYLKALLALSSESGEVYVKDLSEKLGIKMPTVTSMMKALAKKKLVNYEKYKPLRLTRLGEQEASFILRKHRLTEMFLVKIMDFGWHEVHEIAEQIEHIDTPKLFERMDKMLNFPQIDPHGEPIPDKNGKIKTKNSRKLSHCNTGDTVKLSAVSNFSNELLNFLNNRNLQLGTVIKVVSVEQFDGSMVVSYNKRKQETLSHIICERLMVENA